MAPYAMNIFKDVVHIETLHKLEQSHDNQCKKCEEKDRSNAQLVSTFVVYYANGY
jgi:hypothetical protein